MIQKDISLKSISNYKIGGTARYFLDFKNTEELERGLLEWKKISEKSNISYTKIFPIGKGTNILFSDKGYDGLIIRNSIKYIKRKGNTLSVGGGTEIADLNNYCIEHSLSGLEWSGGLPGTFGGAIFGNAGAFGGETKDHVKSITSYDIQTGKIIKRPIEKCAFSYRTSIFKKKKGREIILSAEIYLTPGDKEEIQYKTQEKINYRKEKQPLELPNLGSTFKNIDLNKAPKALIEKCKDVIKNDPFPVIPVAYLISLAGLSGYKVGGAAVSEKHPNFIVNLDKAKASDVKKVIKKVQETLHAKFGVKPETEIIKLPK